MRLPIAAPVAVFGLFIMFIPAAHADGPQSAALALKAAQNLKAYVDDAAKAGTHPDYGAEPVTRYLQQIFDFSAFRTLPPPQAGDMAWLSDWADAVDIATKILTPDGPSQAGRIKPSRRNSESYEAANLAAWVFSLHFQSRSRVTAGEFVKALPAEKRTPVQLKGIAVMRERGVECITAALTLVTPGVTPGGELALISALRDTAPEWIGIVNPQERTRLLNIIGELRKSHAGGKVADGLAALQTALAAARPH
jgi:hypothetical protein